MNANQNHTTQPASHRKVPTKVSQAYWCNPGANYSFEKAFLDLPGSDPDPVLEEGHATAWLDELLGGGIALPDCHSQGAGNPHTKALAILITGLPGTGKSTLATELAYRWSTTEAWKEILTSKTRPRILYITNDSRDSWIARTVARFRWDSPPPEDVFEESQGTYRAIPPGKVRIVPCPTVKDLTDLAKIQAGEAVLDAIKGLVGKSDRLDADVVIVDALNTFIPQSERSLIVESLHSWACSGPRVLLMVQESYPESTQDLAWAFASDMIIRLDHTYHNGYMLRTITIEKSRYQEFALGNHQLKLYGGSSLEERCGATPLSEQVASERMRSHPYQKQGGVFIFPSLHYILSRYKRHSPTGFRQSIESHVPNLNELLVTGYPEGHCTALIGVRGGHKSHLAYVELLSRILPEKDAIRESDCSQKAIIVSLRDDEVVTRTTMHTILQRFGVSNPTSRLADLERSGQLEIIYYPAGYITPEEFIHRLLLSIKRLKRGKISSPEAKPHVSLLLNSLDQLASRFPLCARESIFVPALVQVLNAEEVSSFIVAAPDTQHKADTYGLEDMAELTLNFDRRMCPAEDYIEHIMKALSCRRRVWQVSRKRLHTDRQVIYLKVGRYAGGQAAGAEGILELVEGGKGHPLEGMEVNRDLVFLPSFESKRSARRRLGKTR